MRNFQAWRRQAFIAAAPARRVLLATIQIKIRKDKRKKQSEPWISVHKGKRRNVSAEFMAALPELKYDSNRKKGEKQYVS